MTEVEKDSHTPKKSPGTQVLDAWTRNQDQTLENVLRAFPLLTREEAIQALEEAGFY